MDKGQMECSESREILYEALHQVVLKKPFERVTVNDILQRAGISRSTFYRCFQDKHDLMTSYYERVLEKTLFRFRGDLTWKESVHAIYKAIQDDRHFYRNAFQSSDQNSLKNYIFKMSRTFHLDVLKQNGVDITDWKTVKAIESYIYGNLELTHRWVMEGAKESVEDLFDVFTMVLPAPFLQYFIKQ